jgi:hypothetical protein
MHDRLTTPLALALAAVLLLAISFIPPQAAPVSQASASQDLLAWVASQPLQRDEHRLALLLAVRMSALAIDSVAAEMSRTPFESDPVAAAVDGDVVAPPTRRGTLPARPMMPFYSFASAMPRPQES